ncbi:hypothetical protein [Catellatospora citrea]|uniref:Uncharacterized protein n=1 Tax=Catellatospora citrea TaxID=53366 RepID=A0A8J3KJS2_9ACTN|nr:hypothetical protein [Catellatospora citrea]RKE07946.1 hypothetical protein C8E86_2786 [Catellatospora citrea]GIF98325.1 hypothetical protein Cci01nite_34190 [Catellatospora citrea]
MDPAELRRQVMRRLRYGLNVVALERDLVPPEGPFDVALTNGLAAIVSLEDPGAEGDSRGRMLPASALLKVLEDRGELLDFPALREALDITQPLRHGRADDEYLMPVQRHLQALIDLDRHRALLVLDQARSDSKVEDLVARLYADAANEVAGLDLMSSKERLDQPDFEECDECWRNTFLPDWHDEFGGTNSTGRCVACGYERDDETARAYAIDAELARVMDKD